MHGYNSWPLSVVLHERFQFRRQFTGRRCFGGSRNYFVRFSDENYSQILNMLLGLMIALGALMAFVFSGLSVVLIEVVGCMWPDNGKSQSDRVVMIAGARQTRKQKEKTAKVS
jgi:hypothetical protein